MAELGSKKGWTRVAFGDVVDRVVESGVPSLNQSRTYIGLEHLDSGSLSVRRWGSDVPLVVPKTRIRKGDVLFARRNTHLRRCAIAPFDGFFSPDGYAFRSRPSFLLQELLPYVVSTDQFMDYAVEHSAGTHSKRVKWSDLAHYEFDLPSIEKQAQIALRLAAIDDVVHALRAGARLARHTTDALRAFLVKGEPTTADGATSGRLPRRWRFEKLAGVVDGKYGLVDGPFGSNLKSVHYRSSGYPVLQSAFIANGSFDPNAASWAYVDEQKFREQSRSAVRGGDIAMVKVGVNCGASALLPDELPVGILAGNCLKITPDRTVCNPRYLIHYLVWLRQAGHLERHVTSTQQRALTLGRLREQLIALPPLAEQDEIVDRIESCAGSEIALQNRAEEASTKMVRMREEWLKA